jgi:hypothetical protein
MTIAPVLLFTFKRLDTLKNTVSALRGNHLASESDLFIFSDAARHDGEVSSVQAVRDYLTTIDGFKSVSIIEADNNKGLASSIIQGVSKIIGIHEKVIVLEDDLISSTNFLSFMNQALEYYRNETRVFSIGGYTKPMKLLQEQEVYFTSRGSSWGWATWKDRWKEIDWTAGDYARFSKDKAARKRFNRMGSDLSRMLDRQMNGRINSWAILWCYHQFRKGQYTVFPAVSKICNEGFSAEATHTKEKWSRFRTVLDRSGVEKFHFTDSVELKPAIVKRFTRTYSVPTRITYKLINLVSSFSKIAK